MPITIPSPLKENNNNNSSNNKQSECIVQQVASLISRNSISLITVTTSMILHLSKRSAQYFDAGYFNMRQISQSALFTNYKNIMDESHYGGDGISSLATLSLPDTPLFARPVLRSPRRGASGGRGGNGDSDVDPIFYSSSAQVFAQEFTKIGDNGNINNKAFK